jgi:hypothetical protein
MERRDDGRRGTDETKDDMDERTYRNDSNAIAQGVRPAGSASLVPALLLGALIIAIAGNVHAALYKWSDDRGVVHYSDQLPVDAVNRANYELNRQAMTVRKTEQARPVVRQVPKKESDEQQMRQAERDRVIALRRDRALIESYANEAEIDLAKSRAIATIDGQVQSAEAFIAQIAKRRQELENRKVTYAPRPVPGEIVREIESIDAEIGRQNDFIVARKKETASVAARYDADKQRFNELHSAGSGGAVVTTGDGRRSASQPVGIEFTGAH